MAIAEYTFELDGVPFGKGQAIQVDADGFQPGATTTADQDADNPTTHGRTFGRDLRRPGTWQFVMHTDKHADTDALDAIEALGSAWENDTIAATPTAVQTLRYAVGDRTRRVYGRGRNWSTTPDNRILQGMVVVGGEFQLVDHLHYDDNEILLTLNNDPSSTGGFILPMTLPATSTASGQRSGQMVLGGNRPTSHVIIRITGPDNGTLQAPWVAGPGWRLEWPTMTLQPGQWIEVDARPWVRTARTQSGALAPMSATSRIAKVVVNPGVSEITWGGADPSGTARTTVRLRAANKTL